MYVHIYRPTHTHPHIMSKRNGASSKQAKNTLLRMHQEFPGGTVDKNLSANAGDMGSIPGLGSFHMLRIN